MTQDKLKEVLYYNPSTGIFTWAADIGPRTRVGAVAGHKFTNGYIRIKIFGISWAAHRLAWLYTYGHPIPEFLDHKNRIKGDNRIENLRAATKSQNGGNRSVYANNKSGIKGVTWCAHINKWQAVIQVNKKQTNLGYFKIKEEAALAYKEAAIRLFGEFA